MDCNKINNLLIDFVDKQLNKEETEIVKSHLEKCKKCRQEVEDLAVVMDSINASMDEQPPDSLKSNFLKMLKEEKEKSKVVETKPLKATKIVKQSSYKRILHPVYQVAAGFAILITGMLLGLLINKNDGIDNSELIALQNEVSYMKQVILLSKLDQPSPSSRIQAVNYIDEISAPEPNVIDALIKTMNTDDNTNVRLAATTALSRFTNNAQVREALINSLGTQDDPMVQITLINIMIGLHESRAKQYIEQIATNEKTNKSVKNIAQKGLEILI